MKLNRLIEFIQFHSESENSLFLHHQESYFDLTYNELTQITFKICHILSTLNLKKQSRIIFAAKNHWLVYPLLVACSLKEWILVPINPELHKDELKNILDHSEPSLIIGISEVISVCSGLRKDTTVIELSALLGQISSLNTFDFGSMSNSENLDSTVLIIYTSGTTGNNKAVQLTEKNLISNALALRERYKTTPSDVFYCFMPTYHMNALMITGILPLVSGSNVILAPRFDFKMAGRYWEEMHRYQVTVASLIPPIIKILSKVTESDKKERPSLRFAFCGAAHLEDSVWQEFELKFQLPIYQGYGLTETTCWATSTVPGEATNYKTAGHALNGCEIKFDLKTNEILIGGPIVSPGYFRDRKLNQATYTEDGYFKSGDIGGILNGELQITGRIKELIIRNGIKIIPSVVDEVLKDFPEIKTSKTVGIPDGISGEKAVSVCVFENPEGIKGSEIKSWLTERLSNHLLPDLVYSYKHLPVGPSGKIQLAALRKIVTGELKNEIFGQLKHRQYNRYQPSDSEKIKSMIQTALTKTGVLKMAAYWGCGRHTKFGEHDRYALDRLIEYTTNLKRVSFLEIELKLILTDGHTQINEIPRTVVQEYFEKVVEYCETHSITSCYLTEFWRVKQMQITDLQEQTFEPEFTSNWNQLSLREKLIKQASKHSNSQRPAEDIAKLYFRACILESQAITKELNDHIFLTYNGPEFDMLFPELPKCYLYSMREGTTVKPWFSSENLLN